MAALRRDELRNEGEEKQSRLRVESFRENPLTKGARRRGLRCANDHFRISRADHPDAEPNEIRGTRVLDGVKRHSGSSKDRGDAERSGQDMEESTNKGAEGRKDSFTAASSKAARQYVENARPWSNGEEQRCGKKKQETVCVEHTGIVRARLAGCKVAYELSVVDSKMCSRLRWARLGRPLQALRKADSRESERGRALAGNCEGTLEGDADATQRAFFKEAADQGDAVGHAARRGKLRQRIFRIGRPVRARLGNFNEAGAQRERGMPGLVADGEHFVAQRRN